MLSKLDSCFLDQLLWGVAAGGPAFLLPFFYWLCPRRKRALYFLKTCCLTWRDSLATPLLQHAVTSPAFTSGQTPRQPRDSLLVLGEFVRWEADASEQDGVPKVASASVPCTCVQSAVYTRDPAAIVSGPPGPEFAACWR